MKKESLMVYITKLILTVSIIVSFGALIGAIGYLVSHPRQANVPIINSQVTIIPVEKDVTVTTDKTEYGQGELVNFSLINNSQKDYIISPEFFIEFKTGNNWQVVRINNPTCYTHVPIELGLLSGKTMTDQWDSKKINDCDVKGVSEKMVAGIYRIKAVSSIFRNNKYETINFYSNEFTIKEKTVTDPRCGQKVEGDGICDRTAKGFEFDSINKKCVEKNTGGCKINIPFNSLEECQKVCENGAETGKELKIETIKESIYSGNAEEKKYIIKNWQDWSDLWIKMGNTRIAPIVDFNNDMVIAAFQGEKSTGGYGIEITKIIENENNVEVFIKETSPGKNCITTEALTRPYHIVKVQKSDKEVIFKTEKSVNDCQEAIQNQDVSVVLDKTEYQKGETVNGLIKFNKDIYINPDFRIYKFDNNDWEYLGEWSFDGVQYTCCGLMPTCEENLSKNSPIKFTWDQKIAKEKLPILPSSTITKIQANSGRYKISIIYGDKPVCIDGADIEFIIK